MTDTTPRDDRTTTPHRRRLGRAPAFWTVAGATATMLAASSAPSPLYPVLQQKIGFSALTLTVIFAVYVLALLLSLLTVGSLSDVVGRRPVLLAALLVEAASMGLFLAADGVALLVAARVVQGLATGAGIGVLGAYLLDLQPDDGRRLGSLVNGAAPTAGLALGAVGTGALVQWAPAPTHLVFVVLGVVFLALALVTATLLPETTARTPGALRSLRPQVAVPAAARAEFLGALPSMVATWALGGLVLSVGGSVLASVFGQTDHAVVGLALALFAGTGSVVSVLVRDVSVPATSLGGVTALLVGVGMVELALTTASLPLFVVAAVVAGGGFGAAFLGGLRAVTQLAAPHERAALLSAVYVVSYLAFSIPALVAGVAITRVGLRSTVLAYGGVVALLAAVSLVVQLVPRRTSVPA
ncbi:MFS transporter [Rhodococcus aerolatus]